MSKCPLPYSALISRSLNFVDSCLYSFCWIYFAVPFPHVHAHMGIENFVEYFSQTPLNPTKTVCCYNYTVMQPAFYRSFVAQQTSISPRAKFFERSWCYLEFGTLAHCFSAIGRVTNKQYTICEACACTWCHHSVMSMRYRKTCNVSKKSVSLAIPLWYLGLVSYLGSLYMYTDITFFSQFLTFLSLMIKIQIWFRHRMSCTWNPSRSGR